ncbi:LytTR family DNA-binding domain-containing protein [uncultured Pedobacter sp.]|uniref:LytTR family DNA-binding domain-containing protein n=1 Tax=uncultured Pedobacter sp. TaxID=246139 RepID=UPI00261D8731|nr:LytTR family DNA-binding domain-containing protein [uncultured Pedobacter sp.]
MAKLTATHTVINYRDLAFRLIVCLVGAHIIMLTGEEITTFEAFTIKSYYPVLAINYAIALILAWMVRRITIKLDRRYGWDEHLWIRTLLQLALGLVTVSIVAFFLVFIYFRSFGRSIMESAYPNTQFPLVVALLALLNAFYVIYYFYHRVRSLAKAVGSEVSFAAHIIVDDGREKVNLPSSEIAHISIVGRDILVRTWEKKDYLCGHNLDELEGLLDPKSFFRINRRLIASRSACRSYQPLDYGKLEVTLVPPSVENATVSQRKAPLFKEWIG